MQSQAEQNSILRPRKLSGDIISRIGRYTHMVLVGKWALGAISLLIILTIIVIPLLNKDNGGARISFVSASTGSDDKPIMEKPKLQGVSSNNEPYTATADRAVQKTAELVELFNVQADLFRQDNSWIGLTAKNGLYNSKSAILTLTGDVSLYEDGGYAFTSQRVDIDTKAASAGGEEVIIGQGPLGNLVATGYFIGEGGARMQFGRKGRVKVVIEK